MQQETDKLLEYGRIRETTMVRKDDEGNVVYKLDSRGRRVPARDPVGHTVSKAEQEDASAIYCTACDVVVAQVWSTNGKSGYGWCTRGPGLGIVDTRANALKTAHSALAKEGKRCLCNDR